MEERTNLNSQAVNQTIVSAKKQKKQNRKT